MISKNLASTKHSFEAFEAAQKKLLSNVQLKAMMIRMFLEGLCLFKVGVLKSPAGLLI